MRQNYGKIKNPGIFIQRLSVPSPLYKKKFAKERMANIK